MIFKISSASDLGHWNSSIILIQVHGLRDVQPLACGPHAAQHEVINLLKIFFLLIIFVSICVFNVWPKATLLPVWPRDATRLDTPDRSYAAGPLRACVLLAASLQPCSVPTQSKSTPQAPAFTKPDSNLCSPGTTTLSKLLISLSATCHGICKVSQEASGPKFCIDHSRPPYLLCPYVVNGKMHCALNNCFLVGREDGCDGKIHSERYVHTDD